MQKVLSQEEGPNLNVVFGSRKEKMLLTPPLIFGFSST